MFQTGGKSENEKEGSKKVASKKEKDKKVCLNQNKWNRMNQFYARIHAALESSKASSKESFLLLAGKFLQEGFREFQGFGHWIVGSLEASCNLLFIMVSLKDRIFPERYQWSTSFQDMLLFKECPILRIKFYEAQLSIEQKMQVTFLEFRLYTSLRG